MDVLAILRVRLFGDAPANAACNVGATDVAFGNVETLTSSAIDINATLRIACTLGVPTAQPLDVGTER